MKNTFATDIIKIEENLEEQGTVQKSESLEKLYEMVDYMYSYYLGLPDNGSVKNCITGDRDYFCNQLKTACQKAVSIDIIVAFIMESGVRLIIDELKKAADRGVKLRILTGRYLNITQPSALYLIKDVLGSNVDLRMFDQNKSFHPKAYIFEYALDGDIYLGSSNISLSAMTSGIEWNYRINKIKNQDDFNYFKNTFEYLFTKYSIIMNDNELRKYSNLWKRPRVYDDVDKNEDWINQKGIIVKSPEGIVTPLIRPKGIQIEALYELKKTRLEGFDKGLVVAATGTGKTYIAAFDSMDYKRILYIAHREEILEQAEKSFKSVRQGIKTGYFTGQQKDKECDVLFATVQTIGQQKFLCDKYFSKSEFDYIIIDEFHHAAAGNYRNIIDYFAPKFLLGLTATPERLDNKDVFVLCDYNIVYEARLKEAINKGWLVPFRYYGIFDETDYDNIEYKNGKYNEDELERALMINKRAELILNHYKKYNSKRAFGFCTSRSHASHMAKYFNDNGIKSCAVVSGTGLEYSMDRKDAIEKLNRGEIKVIFSVDMFNEGLDVPSIDMVMFLRPTQSPTIFLQQLGRGLRKSPGKKYLTVLDFVGNYKKAFIIPFLLSGSYSGLEEKIKRGYLPREEEYPEDCLVDFDFRIIDIFKKQSQAREKMFDLLAGDYFRVKEYLKSRPMRLEMFTYMDDDLYDAISNRASLNIFSDYLGF